MNKFRNLKISTKLLIGFILVALISGIIGVIGIYDIQTIAASDKVLYDNMTVPISELSDIGISFQRIRINTRDMITSNDLKEISEFEKTINDLRKKIDVQSAEFKTRILSKELENQYNIFVNLDSKFKTVSEQIISLAKENKDKEANELLNGTGKEIALAENDAIEKLIEMKVKDAEARSVENESSAASTTLILCVLVVLAMCLSILLGWFIARIISKPIKEVVIMIKEMRLGHLGLRLNMKSKDEIGEMAAVMDGFADDLQNVVIGTMKKISDGDVSVNISPKDDKDEITPALKNTIETIRSLISETGNLIKSAQDGKLETRGNANQYSGSWKELVIGVNSLIDAFVSPINVTAHYIDRISKGDIPPRITDNYSGDFNKIKNNLNTLIDNLDNLIAEMKNMSAQHDLGDIDVVVPAEKFEGAYKVMAKGVNDMVNGHITVKKKAMACVSEFVKGNFDAELEKFPGKKAFINDNMEALRKNLKDVNNEINQLVIAAIEGKLSTRANAAVFQGDWNKLTSGLNELLEAVIKPVQEAAVVLNEMANGNLGIRVTGIYKGDHAEIKNALNETLDALSAYVSEISGVLTEMANSNMVVEISGEYKGDFAPIKKALNLIIDSFNQILSDINDASDQVAFGSRQVSDGSQALSQGATEQASSIEELTASITEIATQTKQNAINANEANELALTAKNNAINGNSQMKDMLKAMDEINISSANISKIIKVIDEIAFQTNILALNAAVEAARAGQHGKGFAVVAEEVRNLAARSASAAKETTGLIEGSIKKVETGTKIANDTALALDKIVNDVAKAASLVGTIAIASNDQATGIAQINQGVEQVSTVIQTNSATAEESAAASEELSSQADLLKEMIGRFSLKGQEKQLGKSSTQDKAIRKKENKNIGKKNSMIALSDSEFSFGKY